MKSKSGKINIKALLKDCQDFETTQTIPENYFDDYCKEFERAYNDGYSFDECSRYAHLKVKKELKKQGVKL